MAAGLSKAAVELKKLGVLRAGVVVDRDEESAGGQGGNMEAGIGFLWGVFGGIGCEIIHYVEYEIEVALDALGNTKIDRQGDPRPTQLVELRVQVKFSVSARIGVVDDASHDALVEADTDTATDLTHEVVECLLDIVRSPK